MTDYLTRLPLEVIYMLMKHPELSSNDVMAVGKLNRQMFAVIKPIWQKKKAAELAADWPNPAHIPSPSDVAYAALLAAHRDVILPLEILVRKGEEIKKALNFFPSLEVVRCGAALSRHGIITQLLGLHLCDLDISAVPAEDMASLAKCVSKRIDIINVTGDLSNIFINVKCEVLVIFNTILCTAQTHESRNRNGHGGEEGVALGCDSGHGEACPVQR